MKFKFVSLFTLLAVFSLSVFAQTEPHSIKFEKTTHDFGTVKQGDKTEHTFVFKNTSDAPVKLTNVNASCGCTTPKWPREEIAPGASGEIQVTYNSNRVGGFNKSVRIMYNERTDPVMIYIKGKVNPKEGTATPGTKPGDKGNTGNINTKPPVPSINYSIPRGALAFEKMIENVKHFSSNETKVVEYRIKNVSGQEVKILKDMFETEDGITITPKDYVLKAGQESVIKVTLDGGILKKNNQGDGYFSKRVAFLTDEKEAPKKQLSINGTFKNEFSADELANSPNIEFETVDVNGGKIIEGEKFIYDFKFKNTGKSPLKILSAKASCGCTATKPPGESVGPGEEAAITATFNSKGRVGKQSKSITVKSNDVDNPTVILKFTVEVVKDPFHAGSMMGGSK